MTPAQVTDALLTGFETYWATTGEPMALLYGPNRDVRASELSEFVRFDVQHTTSGIAEISDSSRFKHVRRLGQFVCSIFVARGIGTARSNELLDLCAAYGERFAEGEIWFRDAQLQTVGFVEPGWYQQNVVTAFTYDELRVLA